MPRHTTMKKRVGGTGTRKRVGRTGKGKRGAVTRKRGGNKRRNHLKTTLLSPLTAARDAAASRRLAQAIAFRLGFKPETIGDIMGESGFKDLPLSITKSTPVIKELQNLGQIRWDSDTSPIDFGLGNGGDYRHGRPGITTALKGPVNAGANAATGRRLLQAMALRLGFEPNTIYKIMDEKNLYGVPDTIRKNEEVKGALASLGKLTGNGRELNDIPLVTNNNPAFKDFGKTGNAFSRLAGWKRKEKRAAMLAKKQTRN